VPLLLAALVLSGCGTATAVRGAGPDDPARGAEDAPGAFESPPPVDIAYDGGSASLDPWTYCYGNGCADGAPPDHPHFVGSPPEVWVSYPLDGWTFTAEFKPAGQDCGRWQSTDLEPGADGAWVVHPVGYAGTYDVTLAGRNPDEGDAFTTFRWTTPADGELPEPTARVAVLADHDGTLDSYGVELDLTNLAETPRAADATIEVRDTSGGTVTLVPRRQTGCQPEGSVSWLLDETAAQEATTLTGDTFTYTVSVRLDGVEHVATATWPDEEMPDYGPSVALEFSPPLPALSPRP
jgi:hypothetical protein